MFNKNELLIIKLCMENELYKNKDSIFEDKTKIYQNIIDKCKTNNYTAIKGTIEHDSISNKYKFISPENEFLLSCGTKIALKVNGNLLHGRVEHTEYYCFMTNDNKIAIPLIDINEEIYYIKYE